MEKDITCGIAATNLIYLSKRGKKELGLQLIIIFLVNQFIVWSIQCHKIKKI